MAAGAAPTLATTAAVSSARVGQKFSSRTRPGTSLVLIPSGTLAAGSASERAPWLPRLQVHSQTRRWGPSEEDLTWASAPSLAPFPDAWGRGRGDRGGCLCCGAFGEGWATPFTL